MTYLLKVLLFLFMVIHLLKANLVINVEQRLFGGCGCGSSGNGECNHEPEGTPERGPVPTTMTEESTTTPEQGPSPTTTTEATTTTLEQGPSPTNTTEAATTTPEQGPSPTNTTEAATTTPEQGPSPTNTTEAATTTPEQGPSPTNTTEAATTTPEQGPSPNTTTEEADPCSAAISKMKNDSILLLPNPNDDMEFHLYPVTFEETHCICGTSGKMLYFYALNNFDALRTYLTSKGLTELYWVDITRVGQRFKWFKEWTVEPTMIEDAGGDCGLLSPTAAKPFTTAACDSQRPFICQKMQQ